MKKKDEKKMVKTEDGRSFVEKSDYEKEMVTGVFENKDQPGQSNSFIYGYKGAIETYTLYDGKESTVPRYIARHINNCVIRDTEPEFNDRGLVVGQKPVMRKRFNFFSNF